MPRRRQRSVSHPLAPSPNQPFSVALTPPSSLPFPRRANYSSTRFDIFRELRPARSSRKSISRCFEQQYRASSLFIAPSPPPPSEPLPHSFSVTHPRPFPCTGGAARPPTPPSPMPLFLLRFSFFPSILLPLLFSGGANRGTRTRRIDSSFREDCNGGRRTAGTG